MTIHKLTDRMLPGEVNQDLVEALESLTERAKAGEISGLAWAGVVGAQGNGDLVTGWDGAGGTKFLIGAAIMLLQSRYAESMVDDG